MSAQSTRRGILGLFAAAPIVLPLSGAATQPPAPATPDLSWALTPDGRIDVNKITMDGRPYCRKRYMESIRQKIAENERFLRLRPVVRPELGRDIVLARPACEHACEQCLMSCAILPERTEWWRSELRRLEIDEVAA
jgi:hypothetical protein